ncbi:nitroreductase family protein [Staphylococcus pseudintermedius]|nr:nitroreductase family protein [Staphylococcus pseudintermedius]
MSNYKINQDYKIFNLENDAYIESRLLKIKLEENILNFLKQMIFDPNPVHENIIISKVGYDNFQFLVSIGVFLEDYKPNFSKVYHDNTSMGKNYFPWKIDSTFKFDSEIYIDNNNEIRKSERYFSQNFKYLETQMSSIKKMICKCYGCNYFDGHRGIPSAGNMYPLNIYLVVNSKFYYRVLLFDSSNHSFDEYCSVLTINEFFVGKDIDYDKVPFYVVITYSPERNQKKYGDRGYRFALLEAGMFSQQFNNFLLHDSMGMVNLGSYIEHNFEENLFINEWVIHCIGFGKV